WRAVGRRTCRSRRRLRDVALEGHSRHTAPAGVTEPDTGGEMRTVPPELTFGGWIKRLRAEHDLTQERLAARVGCAVQTIRTCESGTRRPSRAMAERLADALAVPADDRPRFLQQARASVGLSAHAPADAPRSSRAR